VNNIRNINNRDFFQQMLMPPVEEHREEEEEDPNTPSWESKTPELTRAANQAVLAANTQDWRVDRTVRLTFNSSTPKEMQ
jgi:hypothetical protein